MFRQRHADQNRERPDRMQGVVRVASSDRLTSNSQSCILDEAVGVNGRKGDASGELKGGKGSSELRKRKDG
ncbi:hypothetical protein P8452_70843 [Trifolium repens]|nr:hypothetical protein P8452_70843 [Trifolium repens]